ncbi:PREDICTED: uncharacterized protein LOC109207139 [Nicotiana attenuata]|uniref:uncharacterized protein LOC109207139 n=1 Tax=Nicotiana attenuata TaxID=49451 RepID=UPI000904A84B|nr:PREDICTED: uncharacterized protein LOC109207139 [Nicotiana attenuata]
MERYASEKILIAQVGLTAAKPSTTPIDTNVKLTTKEYDEHTSKNDISVEDSTADQTVLYLTITIPDIITYGVQALSQFLQQPKKSHMEDALRIVKYVKNNPGQGILLSSQYINTVTTYCDADWAACPITRRSVTGSFLSNSVIFAFAKELSANATSFANASSQVRALASQLREQGFGFADRKCDLFVRKCENGQSQNATFPSEMRDLGK